MVRTRAATKRIESGKVSSGKVSSGKRAPSKRTATKPSSRPVKKQKPRGGGAKCSEERPQRTLELNLDVLFHIAAYVYPGDLLNLARTCRSLRGLLMDKYSTFVWKMARSTADMPDCPPDLTEPQYANLMFEFDCHACGKYAPKVFWRMYRRYCPDCTVEGLVPLSTCPGVIRSSGVIIKEGVTTRLETIPHVKKEHVDSFMSEFKHSSDKDLFLREKRRQVVATRKHAEACMYWHKNDLRRRQEEREKYVFKRLVQHGYEPEIDYFPSDKIKRSLVSLFKPFKPFTDQEWTKMSPKWLKTMDKRRNERLDITVYGPRRSQLLREYTDYVEHPATDGPIFDFLPHETDLVRLSCFRDIIKAPEGTEMGDKPFESAFAQLPMLVDEWRKDFDAQLAELVEIPSHLSLRVPPGGRVTRSSKVMPTESSQSATDKLHLACAVFAPSYSEFVFFYPEILSAMKHRGGEIENDPIRAASIGNRFNVKHLDDAPYIVRACGLDPNVATVEDMDRQNARLRCRYCQPTFTINWRDALIHARICYPSQRAPLSIEERWENAGYDYTHATQPAKGVAKRKYQWTYLRCLMCHPRVGDCLYRREISSHFRDCHRVSSPREGVNFVGLEMPKSGWNRGHS